MFIAESELISVSIRCSASYSTPSAHRTDTVIFRDCHILSPVRITGYEPRRVAMSTYLQNTRKEHKSQGKLEEKINFFYFCCNEP